MKKVPVKSEGIRGPGKGRPFAGGKTTNVFCRDIPLGLWLAVRGKAAGSGMSVREVLEEALTMWLNRE